MRGWLWQPVSASAIVARIQIGKNNRHLHCLDMDRLLGRGQWSTTENVSLIGPGRSSIRSRALAEKTLHKSKVDSPPWGLLVRSFFNNRYFHHFSLNRPYRFFRNNLRGLPQ